jgi:hypothetical protein
MSDLFDCMDMDYPSDDEFVPYVFRPPSPSDVFTTSWCRNGHDLRIDPGATVWYIITYNRCPVSPLAPLLIQRNGHGHPKMDNGMVQTINHNEQTVTIDGRFGVVSIDWDLVVGREDSKHQSIPVALKGTNDPSDFASYSDGGFWFRRTLEFGPLSRAMVDIKAVYVRRLLREISIVVEPDTLVSIALDPLLGEIASLAAEKRTSFFAVAETMLCIDE